MFFGKKPEPEKVSQSNLTALLNKEFDKRLVGLESKSSGIAKELSTAKADFRTVCSEFEQLDVEPYTEDLWNPNIKSIKSQKAAYSVLLGKIIDDLSIDSQGTSNSYVKYKLIFLNLDDAINNVLKSNANFKTVLYCYSNYMRGFKRSFQTLERLRDLLKSELDKKIEDYNAFNAINESISKLSIQLEEIGALKISMYTLESSLNPSAADEVSKMGQEVNAKISAKQSELSIINNQISTLSNKINLLTVPLDRASKKFDHLSARKAQLNKFIIDPIGTINSEQERATFMELLKELKVAVELGSVDVKNMSETINSISKLASSDIYYDISQLNSIKLSRLDLEKEIRSFEGNLDSLKKSQASKAKILEQIERMRSDLKSFAQYRDTMKIRIEESFSDTYSKPIIITL